ncbi:MAG: single-stranded-DNA-specific exonuclease RecJ [Firmicutes bacterium]|nr:single-stranded-DNA-specific exonuclease RecJ [Bacillota bacterium]
MLRLVPRLQDDMPAALLDAGLPPQLARVLWARGVATGAEAEAFLSPRLSDLHDPFLLHGMEAAVTRIHLALERGEPITVYGDYDVDGVCAAAILIELLRGHGGRADWYIPSRHREGYGLNVDAVARAAETSKLLITVDCGITSIEEAAAAKSLGLDLIITDHHEPLERLPEALAVVNPLLGAYPFRRLCGAGVAFKLGQALFGMEAAMPLLELAALATVADIVPLLGENRIIVRHGLECLQHTRRPGLHALISVSGLDGKVITAGHVGFQLGPRINAGGRLRDAGRNVELLITKDTALARRIAEELHEENVRRQRMEADILGEADAWVKENVDFLREKALIVVGQGWNTGIIGLVASKLAEKYAWPTVVLSETDGVLTGSARSIPGVNLHAALLRCEDLFIRFGGHTQAAGMTLSAENLGAFRERFGEAVESVAEPDAFVPTAAYDMDMGLSHISTSLIEQLERLSPTGFGNPAPVFRLTDGRVLEARSVGVDGKHLKLRLAQGDVALDAIAFGQGGMRPELPERLDALFSPTINEYMGRRTAQCEIARILPHAPEEAFREGCLGRADAFDCALLEEGIALPIGAEGMDENALEALVAQCLTEACQGTLLTVRTLAGAVRWTDWLQKAGLSSRLDFGFGAPRDPRRFNTMIAMPAMGAGEGYERVIALDDALIAREMAKWLPSDDDLRRLYKALRQGFSHFFSETALAEAAGLRVAAVRLGLRVFAELLLADYRPAPFEVILLRPRKCDLGDSALLKRMRQAVWQEVSA